MRKQDNRKHERDSLFLVAELRLERDGAPYSVKLRNISDSGLMAEGAMRASRGRKVWIELANIGLIEGIVAWSAGDRCGIAFEQTIDASQVQFPVGELDLPEQQDIPYEERVSRD
ncbi:PilZ domain-containing protein [Croceicoccus bisphenolivorans]|uniref:PilZ domain-containing protein n=1 Tax=Croceicoccus bisphenolivorans TaxID=1783232 RepID=UPI000833F212|nr:PilZ domain-containing protein [Croceicoccus bisphenolivorans]